LQEEREARERAEQEKMNLQMAMSENPVGAQAAPSAAVIAQSNAVYQEIITTLETQLEEERCVILY
jgi:hypothetical protein